MAQVVRPQGFIGPLVVTVFGVILLLNGVPALFQWIGWVAQTALVIGVEGAIETALIPLLLAGGATFVGFLMLRGGFGALRSVARGATQRAQAQVRGGVQQVRREAGERYGEARTQAEHLQSSQQGWFERIESLGREVESERARRSGQPVAAHQPPRHPQPQQRPQQQRPQQSQPPQQRPQQEQPQRQIHAPQEPRGQRTPGGQRLERIDELRQRVDSRVQQAAQLGDAGTQAAQRVRQAAFEEAARVQQRQLPKPSDDVTRLIGRLDRADAEHVRRQGSSLTRSSLTTSSLSKTSLRLNSLLARRH
ncbi:MAG: hypothetical protein ACQEWM_10990 [Actinomycetota bacterium]